MPDRDWTHRARADSLLRGYLKTGELVAGEYHFLPVNLPNVATGVATAVQSVTVSGEADLAVFAVAAAYSADGGATITANIHGAYTVRITASRNGVRFGRFSRGATAAPDGWIPLHGIAGDGRRPYFLPFPWTIGENESFTVEGFNGSAADAQVWITLHALKIYTRQRAA